MEQEQREYLKTTEVVRVENYPYGRLRTAAFFGLEFKAGKGFRSTFQTINPKTGRLNAIKKETYSPLLVLYRNLETGHIKTEGFFFYEDKDVQKAIDFLDQHFDLYTPEQIEDISLHLLGWFKASMYARKVYCNVNPELLFPIFDEAIKKLVQVAKSKGTLNEFGFIKIDWQAARDLEQKDFNPFKTVNYGSITSPDFGKNPVTSSGHGSGAPANINGDNYNG